MKNKLKRFLPLEIILFVWLVFALPYLLKTQVPFPSKYLANFFSPWSAYKQFASPIKNASMPDIIDQIYPWKHFTIDTFKQSIIPLWNPYSFSGTPHLANYQSAVLSPFNVGFFIFPFIDWWSMLVLLQPLFAGLFTYLYTRSLKQSSAASLVSSLSFMFCGFITCWMGYATLGYSILFLPLALFAVQKYLDTKSSRYLVLLSVSIPLSFFSGHFQISLYFLLFILAYLLFKYIQTRDLCATCYVLLAACFGLLVCAPQLFPSIELYSQSFRSGIFEKIEAIPWGYFATFLVPDMFGNPVTRNAWFGHYAEWNAYMGIVPFFLAVYTLLKIKKPYILFFFVTGIIALLLAFDSPLLSLLIALKVPVISTSAASRIIVLFSFSFAVLAGFGFDNMLDAMRKRKFRPVLVVITFFIVVLATLWGVTFFQLFSSEHAVIARSNLRFPTIIFGGFIIVMLFAVFARFKKTQNILVLTILLLVAFDMVRFTTKWMPSDPKELVYPNVGITKFYSQISSSDRVFGNYRAEDSLMYKLPSIQGYDAVYIRRYGQFIASLNTGKLTDSYRSVVEFPKNGKYSLLGVDFLGVKYIVHKVTDGQKGWEYPFWKYQPDTIKLIFDDHIYQVFENKNASPRAFLVNSLVTKTNSQKILDTMFTSNNLLTHFAVVEESIETNNLSTGSAKIIKYEPNVVGIQTSSEKPSFLVLTDAYYPGWKAYVDGVEAKIYRTDFAFRGVLMPAGYHIVEFKYKPKSFTYGIYTAIIGLVGVTGLCIPRRRKQFKQPNS